MRRTLIGFALAFGLIVGAVANAQSYETAPGRLCMEDMPCFRSDAPTAPLYMRLPAGPFWDQFAPLLGYYEEEK
ncbi:MULTISPECIES: hypothetical protein [Nocardia]|uniref:hypothetical protein n=1 Tax=Nocardia TaxID=1817 RepID=UPI000AEFF654|nr:MULTISPECIES: hypothetical protein [Nocardia]